MGLIKSVLRGGIQNAAPNYSLSDFENDFFRYFYGGWKSITGISVNEETAMKFSAVWGCVKIISEDIGMLPCELRKWRDPKDKSKGSDLAFDLPLFDLLKNQPHPEMNSMSFDETIQSHVLLSGNGYAYKHINLRGQIIKLQLLDWHSIEPRRNKEGNIEYVFRPRQSQSPYLTDPPISGQQVFSFDEIFHIPGLGYNGIVGYSPIRMAMEAVGLGLATEQFASYFFSNGANVGGFFKVPGKIKDKEALKKEFEEKFAGLGKAHKALFLEEGMEFEKLVMPLKEAQFIEGRKFQIEEIARWYRMPMHMLQEMSKATFSNIEHQDLAYVKRTLLPWIRRRELAIDTRLLTRRERDKGYFARYDIDEWLRGDSKTRAEVNHTKRQDGVITANEWRAQDSQNPRQEPEADMLIINGNMREISVVKSEKTVKPTDPTKAKKEVRDEK